MRLNAAQLSSLLQNPRPIAKVEITPQIVKQDCQKVIKTITSENIVNETYVAIAKKLQPGQETAAGFIFLGTNHNLLLTTIIFKDESGEAGLGIALSDFNNGKESLPSEAYMNELSNYQLALVCTNGQHHSAPSQFSINRYRPLLDNQAESIDAAVVRFKFSDCNIDWRSSEFNERLIDSTLEPNQTIPYLFAAVEK